MATDKLELSVDQLKEMFDTCKTQYATPHKKMKLLDQIDRGELWKAVQAKYPSYQILPDSNFVSYIKNNIVASIYAVTKSAQVLPSMPADKDFTTEINNALDYIWDVCDVGYYQFLAGSRAALLNLGITQVGWNTEVSGSSHNPITGENVSLRNVDPMNFMRDPFAKDLESAEYCLTTETYGPSEFLKNPLYAKEFENYRKSGGQPLDVPTNASDRAGVAQAKDYYTLVIFWVRNGEQINEIHTVNAEHILYQKENIQPAMFPFAELYCNLPEGDLIGRSEPSKIVANNIAYNLMDSIALTAEYRNQKPPKFINAQSNINVGAFTKYGNDADHTFIVNGDASKAVHYHQYPTTSNNLPMLKQGLTNAMQTVTGIDDRYTGRDTGSIITTGGTEEMLGRVSQIDMPKILNYERYVKRLTMLILYNYINFAPKRTYVIKDRESLTYKAIEVDFPKIDNEAVFRYAINISSELPKNKARIAAMATELLEKQAQYNQSGAQVEWITPEEWLMFQDIPNKEYFMERMGLQRAASDVEEVATILNTYAGLVQNGMDEESAIMATASAKAAMRKGKMEEPPMEMPSMPNANIPPQMV